MSINTCANKSPLPPEFVLTRRLSRSFGPYFLSIAFLPLLAASKTKARYGDKFQPQIINTVSMNGWTKVRRGVSSLR